jgi:hypothetical protein
MALRAAVGRADAQEEFRVSAGVPLLWSKTHGILTKPIIGIPGAGPLAS